MARSALGYESLKVARDPPLIYRVMPLASGDRRDMYLLAGGWRRCGANRGSLLVRRPRGDLLIGDDIRELEALQGELFQTSDISPAQTMSLAETRKKMES